MERFLQQLASHPAVSLSRVRASPSQYKNKQRGISTCSCGAQAGCDAEHAAGLLAQLAGWLHLIMGLARAAVTDVHAYSDICSLAWAL